MYLYIAPIDRYIATTKSFAVPVNREFATPGPSDDGAEEARAAQNRYIVAMYRCNPMLFPLFSEVSARFAGANRRMVAPVESLIATVIWCHALISR